MTTPITIAVAPDARTAENAATDARMERTIRDRIARAQWQANHPTHRPVLVEGSRQQVVVLIPSVVLAAALIGWNA